LSKGRQKFSSLRGLKLKLKLVIETYSEPLIDAGEKEAAFHFDGVSTVVEQAEIAGRVLVAASLISAASDTCFPSFRCHLHPSAIDSVEDEFVGECLREVALESDA
jgi:hypothetical protein